MIVIKIPLIWYHTRSLTRQRPFKLLTLNAEKGSKNAKFSLNISVVKYCHILLLIYVITFGIPDKRFGSHPTIIRRFKEEISDDVMVNLA